ncbi:hypothetical protein, conserved [Angomonas deanei]|uniref:Uncharacterized protein n=1 Tax=Angomonas deanei TaxID=59799 RepID=A0A7G2CPJ4_9TRYP|nr:hypothetical protein, conserved [Angomonas deanei]
MDSQPFSEEAASTVPSRKESDVPPPQPPAPARPNTASAALFPFRYFAAAEDVAHLPEEVAFERYKQSPAGAAQIRAIQRDQLKIKENEAEVHTLRQQLQAIRGEINAKSRGASPCGGVNVSSIDGTDSDVYEHMTSVQLAVQCRKSSDRLAQLVQGTQHLRRQLERRQATLLDNFTHWRRSSVEEVGTTIRRKVSTASPTPLLDGAEQVREASLGRVIQQDPAGAAFYTAHQRVTSRSRTSQRPASANFH